jgi:adenosylcobyric acid synthase
METCDLVILPGTRATASDLAWLRERRFASALTRRVAEGRSVLGLCGGYQMLGMTIDDDVEGNVGQVDGLGLLPVRTMFQSEKVLARRRVVVEDGSTLEGYEIHHGRVHVEGGDALFADEGCVVGAAAGTLWHGLFENDAWRRAFLSSVAHRAGKRFVPDVAHDFAARREARIDTLADLIGAHLDTDALCAMLDGDRAGLPALTLQRRLEA